MRDSEDHQGLTLVLSCPLSSVGGQAENNSRESTVLYGAFLSSTVFNSELWNWKVQKWLSISVVVGKGGHTMPLGGGGTLHLLGFV